MTPAGLCLEVALFALLVSASHTLADRHVDYRTTDHPLLEAVRAPLPPELDGDLDDVVWSLATRLDSFYCDDLNHAPTESTAVWLAYDREHVYFAARCSDRSPDQLRMDEVRRGNDLSKDDHISLELDIEHQHRYEGAYSFVVTPRGTQSEDVPDGSATKVEWRGDWTAVASVDSAGWTVEAAIPFAMFSLPAGTRTIGVSVERWHARTQEAARWPNMGGQWDRMRAGDWVDIDWPRVRRRPVVMPYLVGGRAGGANERSLGLDLKYLTPVGLTFAGTVNPDTRNVESEILDLDFSYGERWREDHRPFFVEGGEYLPPAPYFYTQRVGSMYGGAKLFGQIGMHRVGILDAYDRDQVNHLAASLWSQPKPGVEFHQMASWWHGPRTTPRRDGIPATTDNVLFTSDFTYRRPVRTTEQYWYAQTRLTSTKGDTGDGVMAEVGWGQWDHNRVPGVHVVLRRTSAGYLPFDAFHELSDSNLWELYVESRYWVLRDNDAVRTTGLWAEGRKAHRLDGDLHEQFINAWIWIETDNHLSCGLNPFIRDRPPYLDRTMGAGLEWNTNNLYTGGEVQAAFGRVQDALQLNLSGEQGIPLWGPLSLRGAAQYVRWDYPRGHALKPAGVEHEYQVRLTGQWDVTHEQSLSGRIIRSTGGWNGYVAFRRTVRRGMDLFVILGDPSAERWRNRLVLKATMVL